MATFKRRYSVGGKGRHSRSNSKSKRQGNSHSKSDTKRNNRSRSTSNTRKTSATVQQQAQQQAQKLFSPEAVKEVDQIIQDGGDKNRILKFVIKYKYTFLAAVALLLIVGKAYSKQEALMKLSSALLTRGSTLLKNIRESDRLRDFFWFLFGKPQADRHSDKLAEAQSVTSGVWDISTESAELFSR